MDQGTEVIVRLFKYRSFRHYGGREITPIPFECKAKYLFSQKDGTEVVELLEDCIGLSAGHKMAILKVNFNIKNIAA